MEDGDAEATVRVDVGVVQWPYEFEIYYMLVTAQRGLPAIFGSRVLKRRTRRGVRIIAGKGHLGLEVTPIVQ